MSNRLSAFRPPARPNRRARRLSLEQLEARQLLAADLQIRFDFVDQQQNSLSELQAGQVFFLDAYVQDIRPVAAGVFQAFIDVAYSNQASTSGPVTAGPAYNAFPTGDASVAGLIDEAGGIDTDQVAPVPPGQELLLFRVPFQAGLAGTFQLTSSLADAATVMFDQVDAEEEIDFLNTSIEVVDSTPRVSIEQSSDGDEDGPVNGQFLVRQSVATQSDTVVTYSVGGSAAAGSDYTALSGSVTILAGDTMAMINVVVNDDSLVEDVEDVTVELTGITAGDPQVTINSGQNSASLSIEDDDSALASIVAVGDGDEEGPVAGAFEVQLSAPSATDTVVSYSLGGTASNGVDFAALTGSVAIPAGNTTAAISVAVVDDDELEGLETVVATLDAVIAGDPQISVDTGNDQATVSIADNDQAAASIVTSSNGDEEGPAAGQFTVELTKASATETQIAYTLAGTAAAGSDYTAPSGVVTIPAGNMMAVIDIPVADDSLVEATETVIVTLDSVVGGGQNVGIDPAADTATLQIADNDSAQVRIEVTSNGSESGPTAGVLMITQTAVSSLDTVVDYLIGGTAANGADYTVLSGSAVIPAGQQSATVQVTVVDDDLVEPTETLVLTIDTVSNDSQSVTVDSSQDEAELEIEDNDSAEIRIQRTADGSETGPQSGMFRLDMSAPSASDTVVAYSVTGSAESPDDYQSLSGMATIPAGTTSVDLPVIVLDDELLEDLESVVVTLDDITSGDEDISIDNADDQAGLDIADDETGVIRIDVTAAGGEEGPADAELTVLQDGITTVDTVISYSVGGTATPGDDYSPLSGTVTIPAGSTSAVIDVAVSDDSVVEGDETVIVTLDNIASGDGRLTLDSAASTATAVIQDNDTALVRVAATNDASESGPAAGLFTVTQGSVTTQDTVIAYDISGSATPGDDYQSLSGMITIPAGQMSATISVDALNDGIVEADETVQIQLQGIVSGSAALEIDLDNDVASLAIADDDEAQVSLTAVADGNEDGPEPAWLTVEQSAASSTDTVVDILLAGTAVEGQDYATHSGQVTIPAGQTSVNLTLNVLDDSLVELAETVVVSLDQVASGDPQISLSEQISDSVEIADNDTATIDFASGSSTALELLGSHTIDVRLNVSGGGEITQPVTVIVQLLGGTADTPDDFTLDVTSVTFPAGSSDGQTMPVILTLADDQVMEDDETILLGLQLETGIGSAVSIGATSEHEVTLTDDPMSGVVAGMVWTDANNNGQWNAGESPLPGVAVRLTGTDSGGRAVDILTFTDNAGQFRIEDLPAGTYELHETQPRYFYDGLDTLGSVGGSANGQAANDHFSQIVLGPGEQASGYNFGERGLRVEHLSAVRFLTSMSVVEANREMVALGQELSGQADIASAVRRHKTFEFRRLGSEVTVIGGEANDVIEFTPAGADPAVAPDARADEHVVRVNGVLLALSAVEVDRFFLLAGEGTDRLILHDSADDDSLTASGAELTLQSGSYRVDAVSHELAAALSNSGGDDTASRSSLEFLLDLEGDWQ